MRLSVSKLEEKFSSVGEGAWGRLEINDEKLALRMHFVRQAEGRVQIYFNGTREQVVGHGRLFSPMTSRIPFYFRAGCSYQITTQIELVEDLPKGVVAEIIGNADLAMMGGVITSSEISKAGAIEFGLYCTRKAELDSMVTLCDLVLKDVSVAEKKISAKGKGKGTTTKEKKGGKDADSTETAVLPVSEE